MSDATVVEFRDNLSDFLGRAQHGRERVTITRNGKAVAAIVSIEDLELLRAIEDRMDLDAARSAIREANESGYVSWDAVKVENDR